MTTSVALHRSSSSSAFLYNEFHHARVHLLRDSSFKVLFYMNVVVAHRRWRWTTASSDVKDNHPFASWTAKPASPTKPFRLPPLLKPLDVFHYYTSTQIRSRSVFQPTSKLSFQPISMISGLTTNPVVDHSYLLLICPIVCFSSLKHLMSWEMETSWSIGLQIQWMFPSVIHLHPHRSPLLNPLVSMLCVRCGGCH